MSSQHRVGLQNQSIGFGDAFAQEVLAVKAEATPGGRPN
jgi:hypothetical protein